MEAGLCLHGTKVASPCQRLTFALAYTPECTPASFYCDGVKHAQHLYLHTPAMTPRLRGQECAIALLPRARIPVPLATVPLGHHPWLVRIARNSPVPQKWCKHIIYLHLTRHCTVGRSWLRTPAHGGTAQHNSALRRSTTQLSAVRAPRGCQGSSSVSAGACAVPAVACAEVASPVTSNPSSRIARCQ